MNIQKAQKPLCRQPTKDIEIKETAPRFKLNAVSILLNNIFIPFSHRAALAPFGN